MSNLNPDSVRGAHVATSADNLKRLPLCFPFLMDGRIWGTDGTILASFPTEAEGRGYILPVGTTWEALAPFLQEDSGVFVRHLNKLYSQPKKYEGADKGFYVVDESAIGGPGAYPDLFKVIPKRVRLESDRTFRQGNASKEVPMAQRQAIRPDLLDAMRQACGLHFEHNGAAEIPLTVIPATGDEIGAHHVFRCRGPRPEWVGIIMPVQADQYPAHQYVDAIPGRFIQTAQDVGPEFSLTMQGEEIQEAEVVA